MARADREYADSAVASVVEALRRYRPDMIVVEYLPPAPPAAPPASSSSGGIS